MIAAVQLSETQMQKAVPVHGVNLELFGAQVGSPDLAKKMIKAGWIEPVYKNLFDTAAIAVCWQRIRNGEDPEADIRKMEGGGR